MNSQDSESINITRQRRNLAHDVNNQILFSVFAFLILLQNNVGITCRFKLNSEIFFIRSTGQQRVCAVTVHFIEKS